LHQRAAAHRASFLLAPLSSDVSYFNDDNFLHLFRLCQLLLEYQLFAWQATTVQANQKKQKYDALKQHAGKLRDALGKVVAENKGLKKEVQYCKKVIQVLEDRATATAQSAQLQQHLGGSVGRYPHHSHQHHFPHPPLPSHQQKPHEEEKEAPAAPTVSFAAQPASIAPATASNVHSHYASQLSEFQAQIAKEVAEATARENAARNRKLENLEQSLQLLLAAQQDEIAKQKQAAEQKQREEEQKRREQQAADPDDTPRTDEFGEPIIDAPVAAPSAPLVAPSPSPSQAAQQQLLNSILHEVAALKAKGKEPSELVGIAAFSPREFAPPAELQHPAVVAQSPLPAQTPMIETPVPVFVTVAPASTTAHSAPSHSHHYQPSIYKFDVQPDPVMSTTAADQQSSYTYPSISPASVAGAKAPVSSPANAPLPRRSPRPFYTAAQQSELDALSKWMRDVEADELGAELAKMQLERSLIERNEKEQQLRELEAMEEAEVQRIEAAVPPDHPLLEDTIMAQQAMTQSMRPPMASPTSSTMSVAGSPNPQPMPSPTRAPFTSPTQPQLHRGSTLTVPSPPFGLTIEVRSPVSLGVQPGAPVVVGNTLLMAPPVAPLSTPSFLPSLSSTRSAVLPPAPLAPDAEPVRSQEERVENLLAMAPNERIKALAEEKQRIRLKAVLLARTGVEHTLYTPFPSLPFLGSLYHIEAEDLRECYDLTFLWADTAMRTEANAQELLRFAVQTDVTGEIYTEVQERLDSVMQYYQPPQSQLDDEAHLRELEAHLEVTAQEENERAPREARWHEDRISTFERQWLELQQTEEDRAYYAELQEKNRHIDAEVEFREYLSNLEQKHQRWEQQRHHEQQVAQQQQQHDLGPLYFPPTSTATTFAEATRSPKAATGALRAAPTQAERASAGGVRAPSSTGAKSTLSSSIPPTRKRAPTLPEKMAAKKRKQEQAAKARMLAMKGGDDEDDDDDDDEEDEEFDESNEETEEEHKTTDADTARSSRGALSSRRRSLSKEEKKARSTTASPTRDANKPSTTGGVNATPLPKAASQSKIQLGSPHAPKSNLIKGGLPPSNPKAMKTSATANKSTTSKQPHPSDADDEITAGKPDSDDEPDDEDDDAAARQHVANLAGGGQFSRPSSGENKRASGGLLASSSRPATAVGSGDSEVSEFHNSTPEKGLAIAHAQIGAPPVSSDFPVSNPASRTNTQTSEARRSSGGATVGGGPLFSSSSLSRPKTSSGSGIGSASGRASSKPRTARFLTGGDEFEDDSEEEEEVEVAATYERTEEANVPVARASPTDFTADSGAPRTLNPRRAAAVNLSTAGKPIAGSYQPSSFNAAPAQARNTVVSGGGGGSNYTSSRPIGTLLSQGDHFGGPGDSDGNVSDVSSVLNLEEDSSRKKDDTVIGSADLGLPASSASLPIQSPMLLSGISAGSGGSGILQSGRGRPRGQPSKLSSINNPSSSSSAQASVAPPDEDSLSSLLGGGMMKRPTTGRGLSSAGGFRTKLPKPESDNDSSLDLND
jgi:hypothetical protein